jgi:hypothetical protein
METQTEWTKSARAGGFVLPCFRRAPGFIKPLRGTGVFKVKSCLLSPAHCMPRCNKAPIHTNYRTPPPLCASLFRVGAWNDEITGPSKIDRGADALLAYPGTSCPGYVTDVRYLEAGTSTNCCNKDGNEKKKSEVTRAIHNRFRLMNSRESLPAHERKSRRSPTNDQD